MLIDIRNYIRKQGGVVSLDTLMLHFDSDADALRAVIQHWIARGKIHKLPTRACSGCKVCAPEKLEKYQWIDS